MFYSEKPKSKFLRRFIWVYLVFAFLCVSFLGGLYVGARRYSAGALSLEGGKVKNKDAPAPYLLQDVDFNLLWEVWNIAKERYLEQPVLDTQLFYGALSGIVASLGDPYSAFLEPETTKKFNEDLSGMFDGIGAEIGIRSEQLVIIAPLPDTPAALSGLKSRDRILAIDGEDTQGMPLDIAVSKIRGEKDTTVVLTILSDGQEESREVPIVRGTINVKSVRWEARDDGIMYVRIIYFNETTLESFEEVLRKIAEHNARAVVLDLRNNPGGFLEVAVKLASEWIDPGQVVVFQEFRGGEREAFEAYGQPRLKGTPTVVLINDGSASASEIVAGALRDHKAATLVGEQSFGKGSVQNYERLRGGSSIKITVAHWLTPSGDIINEEGIEPDFAVELTREDVENEKDPQLEKAVEILSRVSY